MMNTASRWLLALLITMFSAGIATDNLAFAQPGHSNAGGRDKDEGDGDPTDPSFAPAIAYSDFGSLYVMNEDGSHVTNIFDPWEYDDPHIPHNNGFNWAPTGSVIAFANQWASRLEGRGIYTVSLAPESFGEITPIVLESTLETDTYTEVRVPTSPAWTPDGTLIAFVEYVDRIFVDENEDDWYYEEIWGFDLVDRSTELLFEFHPTDEERKIRENWFPSGSLRWSVDGTRLMVIMAERFLGPANSDFHLAVIDPAHQQWHEVTTPAGYRIAGTRASGDWSRTDDNLIVFVATEEESTHETLFITDVTDPSDPLHYPTPVTGTELRYPSWSPLDDRLVVWMGSGSNQDGIYMVSIDGEDQTQLHRTSVSMLDWHRGFELDSEDPEDPEDPKDPMVELFVGVSYSTAGGGGRHLEVTVTVAGDDGPLSGAAVEATLVNLDGGEWDYSDTTEGDGTVTFRRNNAPSGEYMLLIHDVFHPDYEWDGQYDDPGHIQ